MTNKVLIILSVFVLAIALAFDVNYINYARPVEHKEFESIDMEDFKGFSRIYQDLYGEKEFAFIESEIKIVSDKYPFVKAYFHPARSYTYKTNTVGEEKLLTHELYHFHITEYIARKMRKALAEGTVNGDLDAILTKFKTEENILQQQYDSETHHSYYLGEQLKWQAKVDSLLYDLNQYR